MTQSAWIAGFLLAGFVLFLAARNRLSTYAGVLWGPTQAKLAVPPPTSQASQRAAGGEITGIPPIDAGQVAMDTIGAFAGF